MRREPIYHDSRMARLYDAANPWSADRQFCLNLAEGRTAVLDLGCGTGSLASAISLTHHCRVTGVDPAQAMLDQVVYHQGHEGVRWVCADARDVRLDQKFDLIVMTGHAFQCFLTAEDQLAVLQTIAAHLAPNGQFVFDSRNPRVEEWREWTPETSRHLFLHPEYGEVEAWDNVEFDHNAQIATYEWFYRLPSGEIAHAPAARIAFPTRDEIASLIEKAGLRVERWMGDWGGSAISDYSIEIIPIGVLGNGSSTREGCYALMSEAETPATATGFFMASRRNGSPSS